MGCMTSLETIYESVGINLQDLKAQVAEHRRMSNNTELVLADHFPVEDLACAIEQLAERLSTIVDTVTPDVEDYYVGDIAKDVLVAATDNGLDAVNVVRSELGVPGNEPGTTLNNCPIFGHPDLRCVTHSRLNFGTKSFEHSSYLVNVRTGEVTAVPEDETAVEAAHRLACESHEKSV